MLIFSKKYFLWACVIFVMEVMIALFVRDNFVRPYVGDVLVVILMYCFLRSFLKTPVVATALVVLLFSFVIEFLQYLNIVERLGVQRSVILSTVLGTSFAWNDIVAYVVGDAIILVVETMRLKPRTQIRI